MSDQGRPADFLQVDRRTVLRGALGLALATSAQRLLAAPSDPDEVRLASGYTHDLILRWGDPLFADTPPLDARISRHGVLSLDPAIAARQFGYNCDGLHFFPLGRGGRRGLLAVNHEYPSSEMYLPGLVGQTGDLPPAELRRYMLSHPQVVALNHAMLGISVTLIEQDRRGRWRHRPGSRWARRITTTTPFSISGPARGHALLRTRADPAATLVIGTLANCAGGQTPWGTYLSAEENVDECFGNGDALQKAPRRMREAHRRLPPRQHSLYGWEHVDPRFDVAQEPAEMLRFGWVVEVDPRDPASTPRKRTALGRFKHECASCAQAKDGRLAVYMGDDQVFEYVYKYVSRGRVRGGDIAANDQLLDDGVLQVARFNADGSGEWLPLVHGRGPLTRRNGFADQGEVLIKARAAADLLEATPMDRPEDLAADGASGRVYVSLSKNRARTATPAARHGQWA